jgi:3-deoxy-7-phosphoheptulonate synthase
MILTLKPTVTKSQQDAITKKIKQLGFTPHTTHGKEFTIIGVIGENAIRTRDAFEGMDGIDFITPISKPYKLVSREFKKENSIIDVGHGVSIGGDRIVVMATTSNSPTTSKVVLSQVSSSQQLKKVLKNPWIEEWLPASKWLVSRWSYMMVLTTM